MRKFNARAMRAKARPRLNFDAPGTGKMPPASWVRRRRRPPPRRGQQPASIHLTIG